VPASTEASTQNKLADLLVGVLSQIEAGEMAASAAYRHRLEGAVTALRATRSGKTEDRGHVVLEVNDELVERKGWIRSSRCSYEVVTAALPSMASPWVPVDWDKALEAATGKAFDDPPAFDSRGSRLEGRVVAH
jgi:hypothetical protein